MQAKILLDYSSNYLSVEEEEKTRFLRTILEQMGVPIDEFWGSELVLSIEQRMQLRNILSTFNIKIIDDLDGHMQIYVENELVGEWNKCTYVLKKDLREIDPKKRLYLEMTVDCWSLFDEMDAEPANEEIEYEYEYK